MILAAAALLLNVVPITPAHGCIATPGLDCPIGAFPVFFELGRAEITQQTWQILTPTAARIQEQRPSRLQLIGHTDRSATEEGNQSLAEQRACAVAGALVSLGVEGDRLDIGATVGGYRIPTARDVAEPQNRYVEVVLDGSTDAAGTGALTCDLSGVTAVPTEAMEKRLDEAMSSSDSERNFALSKLIWLRPLSDDAVLVPWLIKHHQDLSHTYAFEIARRLFDSDRNTALDWYLIGKVGTLYFWLQCGNLVENFTPGFDDNAVLVAEYLRDHAEQRSEALRRIQTRRDLFSNTAPPCQDKAANQSAIQNFIRRLLGNPSAFYVKFVEWRAPH
jgi:hypothetical protein